MIYDWSLVIVSAMIIFGARNFHLDALWGKKTGRNRS